MKNVILRSSVTKGWRCSTHLLAFLMLAALSLSTFAAYAQVTVSGKVSDETGMGLPRANVLVKGTTSGTTTDADGNYTIEVESEEVVLLYSFIGYLTEEVLVGKQSVINVQLTPSVESLSEVVVIGYGVQRAESVTGSVASVKEDVITEVPSSNISQTLKGRIAGVEMSQTSTKPGAETQIRIRGTRSLQLYGANDPLIVLDGIPFSGSISDINPNTIKSVDILKDASATAIYGSRGANGVIIVTSKAGKRGEKAQISYNGYYGVKKVFAKYPMMSGPEFVKLRADAGRYTNTGDESDDINTDWQDLLFQDGMITDHNLGVRGGSEKAAYTVNLGYFKEQAVLPLNNYKRFSLNASLDQSIGEYVKVGYNTTNSYAITAFNSVGPNSLGRSPILNIYNPDGTVKDRVEEQTSGTQWVYTRDKLLALGDKYADEKKRFASYNAIWGNVNIPWVEGLSYRINVGLDFTTENSGYYRGEGVFSGNPSDPSFASVSNTLKTNWAVENIITYDRTFAGKHNVNFTGLYSAEQYKRHGSYVEARYIPSDQFQYFNLGTAPGSQVTIPDADWRQPYDITGLRSYMARLMYSYDDKYMLSVAVRSDESSRLAPGHKQHSYPAFSAGWNITEENFMQGVSFVDNLKLRVGYGQTSNQSVPSYKTWGLLKPSYYNFGDDYVAGVIPQELPNPELGWEYSESTNLGLDFAFLNNRISGTIEGYISTTNGVQYKTKIPITNGVGELTQNVAVTENKGFELSLNGLILDDYNGFTWEAGLNLYRNKNKILELYSGQERDEANGWFVGYPIQVIYDHEKIGLWQEEDPYLNILEPGGNVGMIKVKYTGEYNADGTPVRAIGDDDKQIIPIDPDIQGGFNTRVAYKGFDLSAVTTFKIGGKLYSTLYAGQGYLNNNNARAGNNVKIDYWSPENTDAKYPKPGQSGDNPKYANTLGLFNASYLKFRTISLGYNFEQDFVKNAGIQNLRLYFTVENPFVMFSEFNRESGLDPEPNSYGDENVAVGGRRDILIVGTNTPSTRSFLVGLNLTF